MRVHKLQNVQNALDLLQRKKVCASLVRRQVSIFFWLCEATFTFVQPNERKPGIKASMWLGFLGVHLEKSPYMAVLPRHVAQKRGELQTSSVGFL